MVEPENIGEPENDSARFWRFALRVYTPEEARALFLRVQDGAGVDVPLALFCLWCGSERLALSEPSMRAAVAFSAAWRRERVAPLRALRRGWKGAPGPFPPGLSEQARQSVARAEQAVERLQMDHLAALREGETEQMPCMRANLDLYARLADLVLEEESLTQLARLLQDQQDAGSSPGAT